MIYIYMQFLILSYYVHNVLFKLIEYFFFFNLLLLLILLKAWEFF